MNKYIFNIAAALLVLGMVVSCSSGDDGGGDGSSSSGGGKGKSSSSGIDDGKTYQTVIIGEQTWFKQNLGGEYTWASAMDLPSECNDKPNSPPCKITLPHRGKCPEGFHIPSSFEWGKLYQYVMANMVGDYVDPCEYLGSICEYPGSQNKGIPDTYGFSADEGTKTSWWAADLVEWSILGSIGGSTPFTYIFRQFQNLPREYHSIRCLKDGAIYKKIPDKKQLTDTRDNQTYKTIMIGRQNWMAENLKYKATGSKCGDDDKKLKDSNTTTCDNYGRLYNWATAMNLPSKCNEALSTSDADCSKNAVHQGVCPSGWHLPSGDEWRELGGYAFFGYGSLRAANGWGTEETKSLSGPVEYDLNGTDDYGFSALPSSYGYVDTYEGRKSSVYWSASEETNEKALDSWLSPARVVGGGSDAIGDARGNNGIIGKEDKPYYFSVRCVKD